MTTHSVYDTVKGAAVGTYLQVRTAAASAYLGVGVLQRSRPNARARRGIRLNFADSDHQQQVIAGSCRPPIAHTHAMPVPVRPIGRTGTEVNAVTTSRKSKPRSQSQKTAVPDNRSHQANNSHSLRDSAARLSWGFCAIRSLMLWISWTLNWRAQ